MRAFIVSEMREGKSDEEITATLVKSYGEQILMAPPVEGTHIIIWLLPFILLLCGGFFVFRAGRRG
jgi:cytochrome c-type biogenesis protein CcmH